MIQCPNPGCNAENPTNAKSCRKCGVAFTPLNRYRQLIISGLQNLFVFNRSKTRETFILDTFSNISFQSVSVVHIRFVSRFIVFLCVLFSVIAIFLTYSIGRSVIYDLDRYIMDYINYAAIGCSIIAGICIISILKWAYRKFQYNETRTIVVCSICRKQILYAEDDYSMDGC